MKKIMLFIILGLSSNLCFSQLNVTNLSGATLDIGAQFSPETDPLCGGPSDITSEVHYLVTDGSTENFAIPYLNEPFRVGCYKSVDPTTNGHTQTECYLGTQITCSVTGSFTFVWADCFNVTIY